MGRKAKRLKILKRIERLTAQADQPIPVVSNSEMQERVKKEVPPAPVEEPKLDVAEAIVEEAKELVEEPEPQPKPKPKATRAKKPRSTSTRTRKKKIVE